MNKYPIKEIFKIHGGVNGLTEKIIYENQAKKPEDNIIVFSGATDESFLLPKVNKNLVINGKPIKIFSKNKKYIIVARKGKAGLMKLIRGINFTINDDAYIMELKKPFQNKVNLEYFIFKYQSVFFTFVSSKDANGTFSKEIAQNYEIELEPMEIQNEFIKIYNKKQNIINKLNNMILKIDKQIKKIVIPDKSKTKKFLIKDLFLHFQGHQLTDKYIYDNKGNIPVYSGSNNEIKGYINKPLFENKERLPVIIYQTKGNNLFKSKVINHLFNTNNTAVLWIKKSKKNIININYINMIIALNLKLSISSQEGVSYIDRKILHTEIFLPDIEIQNKIYKEYEKLLNIKTKLKSILQQIENN